MTKGCFREQYYHTHMFNIQWTTLLKSFPLSDVQLCTIFMAQLIYLIQPLCCDLSMTRAFADRDDWDTLIKVCGKKGPARGSNRECACLSFCLLNQSDVWRQQTISFFRFKAIRPACESVVLQHCSDEAFKDHWVEDDVHYLLGENLIDLSVAFMRLNGT